MLTSSIVLVISESTSKAVSAITFPLLSKHGLTSTNSTHATLPLLIIPFIISIISYWSNPLETGVPVPFDY